MPIHKKKSSKPAAKAAKPDHSQLAFRQSLEDFFTNYHLKEVDEHLWDWLVAGITRENCLYSDAKERANLIFFYEQMNDLFGELWQLHSDPPQQPAQ
ncbi:hypothetical protein D3H65_28300 [Paraflavitalea soli]|uniref:Uncharacterized protein n=1 Tax=Paraflavitalea soli TaxID=2315862 RepID=A0A3B7MX94_9BACT|nr:hypothetical protein [Paraflavitalea soli]AXY77646.1 hypothetical protein D3H65_28300 [Paraflavitalea soli]